MTHSLMPAALMRAHVEINLGTFFDCYSSDQGVAVVTSNKVPDFFWNYAFLEYSGSFSPEAIEIATKRLSRHHRSPALWQPVEQEPPSGWEVCSSEAWMLIERSSWHPAPREQPTSLRISPVLRPTPDMIEVFNDAYGAEGSPGDVGYYELPAEYGEAYGESTPRDGVVLQHLRADLHGTCVAVAMVGVWQGIGGIYSVATRHSHRRRGYGRAISLAASRLAFECDAATVMLQTAADSAVEEMYGALGYRRSHVGSLLKAKACP